MSSCEYCKIFKNNFFNRAPLVAASGKHLKIKLFAKMVIFIPFVAFPNYHKRSSGVKIEVVMTSQIFSDFKYINQVVLFGINLVKTTCKTMHVETSIW